MRAVDAEFDVLQRRLLGGHDVHVHAELVSEHAQRVADAALAVEREAGRERMQGRMLVGDGLLRCRGQDTAQVRRIDLVPAKIDGGRVDVAAKATRRDVDDERIDGDASHAFRRVHGQPDGAFHGVEVDDDAALDAARLLMSDAHHLDAMGAAGQQLAALARRQLADHADDLRRTDVENGHRARPLERERPQPRKSERRGAEETHA